MIREIGLLIFAIVILFVILDIVSDGTVGDVIFRKRKK